MEREEFLKIMRFPTEWLAWEMYPDELADFQLSRYERGHENASEHDRNGAFHWWLKREPDKDVLEKLVRLSQLDPDHGLGQHVRKRILQSTNCDEDIKRLIGDIESSE